MTGSDTSLADLRRWAISGAVVVLAHGGIAAAMVGWREPIDLSDAAAAIVVEFAPAPLAPAASQTQLPPGPEILSDRPTGAKQPHEI